MSRWKEPGCDSFGDLRRACDRFMDRRGMKKVGMAEMRDRWQRRVEESKGEGAR